MYKKEFCQKLVEYMKTGLSFESFGAEVDASKQTLYNWLEKHTEFVDARRKGESYARQQWERWGIQGMTNQIPFFNGHIWAFGMKNKFREEWKDQVDVHESSKRKIELTTDTAKMSEKELTQAYKELVENDD